MMKSMMFALAALAAFQAAAITATKEYVDRKDAEIRTNVYTRAETDARIAELAPLGITTNDVCNIVTNEVNSGWSEWTVTTNGLPAKGFYVEMDYENEVIAIYDPNFPYEPVIELWYDQDESPTSIEDVSEVSGTVWDTYADIAGISRDTTFSAKRNRTTRNALGLARLTDLAPSISNTVTKAFVEDLGIESGIQEETDPVWAGDKPNFATRQSVAVVSNLAAAAETKANTLISYVNGDDVMDVVTNYDSAVHMPSRSLRQRVEDGGTNVWRVVWDEMTRWDWFMYTYMPANYCNRSEINAALDEKADRAWGYYDSHTGGWSPDGYMQISSPKILIAAGMAYQRHVVTGGAVWVLESNGLATEIGGVASNGFFRISDDDGNSLFEIVKGSKRTVGSAAGSFATTNIMGVTHAYITYAVESAEHPTIEATSDLGTAFVSEDSASSLVNVTWSGSSGDWHAEVWPKVASPRMFVRASHEVGGETYIKNTAATGLDGGLIYNGIRYRVVPFATGGKTYLTLEAW